MLEAARSTPQARRPPNVQLRRVGKSSVMTEENIDGLDVVEWYFLDSDIAGWSPESTFTMRRGRKVAVARAASDRMNSTTELAAEKRHRVASMTKNVAASFVRRLVNVGRFAACLIAKFVHKVPDKAGGPVGSVGVRGSFAGGERLMRQAAILFLVDEFVDAADATMEAGSSKNGSDDAILERVDYTHSPNEGVCHDQRVYLRWLTKKGAVFGGSMRELCLKGLWESRTN